MKAVQSDTTLRLSPLALAIALAMPTLGLAQEQAQRERPQAAPTQQPQAGETAKLEAVVVTANKRKEKLMEVPAAISVLDATLLDRAAVKEMDDLPSLSPAMTISYGNQPGNFSLYMRGVGTYSIGIGVEADVAVIIDDVPLALQANAFKDLADVARIEVLKGPQSTLFGKAAIAGALNITTRPITDEARGNLLLTSDGETRLGASYGAIVSDQFRMRLAASTTDFPGVVKNLYDGKSINGSKGKTAIGKLEWTPTSDLTFTLSPRYNQQDKNCCVSPFSMMTVTTPGGGLPQYVNGNFNLPDNAANRSNPNLLAKNLLAGIPISPRNVFVRNNYPAGGESRDYGAGFRVDYAPEDGPLAGHALSSITSYGNYRMNDWQDVDALDQNILQYSTTPALAAANPLGPTQYGTFGTKSVTQELRLVSPDRQGFRYVAGLWYAKNKLDRTLTKLPFELPVAYSGTYTTTAYNTNYAVFGQGTLDLTDQTSLVAGLRLNHENTGYTYNRPIGIAPLYAGQRDDSENSTTGKLGIEHRFDKDVMAYGLFSTGHKGVGYDLVSTLTPTQAATFPVPSESAKNFELGTKAMLLDNRASISVALFRTTFKNFQQSAPFIDPVTGGTLTILTSIGGLQTKGLEVDGSIRVSREFTLNGSVGYTRATYTDFQNGPCYNVLNATGTGQVAGPNCAANPKYGTAAVRDLKGLTLPNAPKLKFNIGGQYDIALPGQSFDLFVNGAYRWQDKVLFNHNQDPEFVTQKAYGILDAGFGLRDKKRGYSFTIFAKNLLDKLYANGLQYAPRNGNWSTSGTLSGVAPVNVSTQNWTPPRDYTRYFGAKLDLSF